MEIVEEISIEEVREIVRLIYARYGHDFRNYAEASLKRRISRFSVIAATPVFDIKYHLVNDPVFFQWMLQSLTVNVTEMFRDPAFYKMIADAIIPVLSTYPVIKIWHAGCSTGEEAFSLAILLHEAGILKRCRIYATDVNMANIEKALCGAMPVADLKDYALNYKKSGGGHDLSDYFDIDGHTATIRKEIRDTILFSQHNLVTDYVFNEFQLICCRNVLIYFKKELQNRVLNLFWQSLSPLGYLALGTKESLLFSDCANKFETVSQKEKIFRLRD